MEAAFWIAIVGIFGTLTSPIITSTLTLRVEKSRQRHEREMDKERREHEDWIQRRKDRLVAYERYTKLITLASVGSPVEWEAMAESISAVELRSSEGLSDKARELLYPAADASEARGDKERAIVVRLRQKRAEFRAAARKELET